MAAALIFNHDGYGLLAALAQTAMRERDVVELLIAPLAAAGISAIDWCIVSTGAHNCRTRHGRLYDSSLLGRCLAEKPDASQHTDRQAICRVIEHFAAQPRDLCEVMIVQGRAHGLQVLGNLRLNHANWSAMLDGVPGVGFGVGGAARKDFRDEAFQNYLLECCEDLLLKGVDGLSLDFERKAPFFPDDATATERFDACRGFLRRVRRLSDRRVVVRVCHDEAKGGPQGQDPLAWIAEGLVDAVIPATHNHEPDRLDWDIARFRTAAATAPRPVAIWPQIWPTDGPWRERDSVWTAPDRIVARGRQLLDDGAAGLYFFNFHNHWLGPWAQDRAAYDAMFRELRSGAG